MIGLNLRSGDVTRQLFTQFPVMDFKYRWKNGVPPTRDQAARSDTESLLDESQFNDEKDHQLAEDMARKQLNVPARPADANRSILPHGDASEQADMNKP